MTTLYTAAQVRALDDAEIKHCGSALVLMKRAGLAAYRKLFELWPSCDQLIIFCGSGNNAGDGYVLAKLAAARGLAVSVLALKPPQSLRDHAAIVAQEALATGLEVFDYHSLQVEPHISGCYPVIVDALLGTGAVAQPRADFVRAIDWINRQAHPIFAIDLPSGLNADTGSPQGAVVNATATLSFIGRKRGAYTGEGRECSGERYFDDLGLSRDAASQIESNSLLLEPQALIAALARSVNTHKGSHGYVAVIGGREGLGGAALLAAQSSLYAGAGLTSLLSTDQTLQASLARMPEVMARCVGADTDFADALARANVCCLGPGLGTGAESLSIARSVLACSSQLVLDADALTLLASGQLSSVQSDIVLTPHPGEAATLLGLSPAEVQRDRFGAAESIQQRFGGIVVLKGAGSLVYDGHTHWVCDCGNPGMAVGGMGDVLAGLIAALWAQGLSALEAAQLGVWAHSRGADILAREQGQLGLLPTELMTTIRTLLNAKLD